MAVVRSDSRVVEASDDVVRIRQLVREWAVAAGLTLVDQTKLITAASELARNQVQYGGGGTVRIDFLNNDMKRGIRLVFEDHGPGISDIDQALKDGFTTGSGLGLGLGGARRLVDEFEIQSHAGEGTRITITQWK